MIINHNLMANNAINRMNSNSNAASKSMQKLSSGLRINSAADDAAGLSISEKMRGQIRGLDQASSNAQDGISMIQTAEGALNETTSILQRMRELATQASNDTNVTVDRDSIQSEMNQLTSEINRIGNTTEFNTQKVLDGGATQGTKGAAATGATTATGTAKAAIVTASAVMTSANLSSNISGETLTVKVDGGSAKTITFSAGDTTVSAVVSKINATVSGLASVVSGKLVLTGTKTGTSGSVEIMSSSTGLTDLHLKAAKTNGTGTAGTSGTTSSTTGEFTATLQIGANKGQAFKISIGDMRAVALGISKAAGATAATGTTTATGTAKAATVTASAVMTSANLSSNISGETLTVKVDGGSAKTITFSAGDTTVSAVVSKINATVSGLASVVSGKLVLAGTKTGTSGSVEIMSSSTGLTDLHLKAAKTNGTGTTGSGTTSSGTAFTTAAGVTDGTTDSDVESALDVSTHDNATNAIDVIDKAINKVSAERSKLGAYQNRLEHTINNLGTSSENMTAAESRIRDVDMAKEMSTFSKNNILSQAAQAMLAQANQQPQQVLQLLR